MFVISGAQAQNKEPIKIGFSMALTGPLAPNGKQALLGAKIWEEEVNRKGGLIGRPVKLVYYDDQSNPSTVPGIYTKLLDVDKVDLVVGPYATAMIAPAMPVVISKNKVFIGLFGLAVNSKFNYPKYFSMLPSGPDTKPAFTDGFFQVAAQQKLKTVALAWSDLEFSKNACEGARENAKKFGQKIVYDKSYPGNTTDFTPIVRALQAANADAVVVCSYPLDSVGMVLAIKEVGYKPKLLGGAMVGLQATVFKNKLGPALNGIINYETWVPSQATPATNEFLKIYQAKAGAEGVDPLAITWVPGDTPILRCWATRSKRPTASTTTRSPTICAATRSRRSWATSPSARVPRENGPSHACCRCNIMASSRARASRPGRAWTTRPCSPRLT
jgi:branched-chain amino acid transport system substrate-binding protein